MINKTLLLIDDDEDFLRALTNRCEGLGFKVEATRNLLSATLKTVKRVPDIICTDVHTPTGNGLAFCDALAADPATAHVPLIVLTGKRDLRTRNACRRLGAQYVEKTLDYWSKLEPILHRLAADVPADGPRRDRDAASRETPTGLVQTIPGTEMRERVGEPRKKRILVADDDADMVKMLSERCRSLGCSVTGVNNALDAINEIHRLAPDLVCLDVRMPHGNGLSVCEMMASDEKLQKIPTIILTGEPEKSTIRRCHDMMAYYVEKSANTWARVEPLVRELLHLDDVIPVTKSAPREQTAAAGAGQATDKEHRRKDLLDAAFAVLGASAGEKGADAESEEAPSESYRAEKIPWVLCIDDDVDFSDALKIRLEEYGVAVIRAYSGMEGYRLAFTSPASAILLDFNMPDGQGDYILNRLKDNPVTKDIPVIVITGESDKTLERRMRAMGATEYFVKPVRFEQLREHLSNYIDILDLPEKASAVDESGERSRRIVHHSSEPG